MAVKILIAHFQGGTYPAMMAMSSHWVPEDEKATLAGFIWAGSQFGMVLALPVGGLIAQHSSWDNVFYLFGTLTLIWFGFWTTLTFSFPAHHPSISEVTVQSLVFDIKTTFRNT